MSGNSGNSGGGEYSVVERGSLYSLDYRIYLRDANGQLVSPWHDIPLYANNCEKKVFNMVVEIPRWTNAKMEMATNEPLNPIHQDEKKGAPRFVNNIFPHHGYIWNYGALPQTWEDPSQTDEHTGANGDNDPIDIVEIGSKVHSRGAVIQVKLLGTLALLDEGETDWKLVGIDVTDPLAAVMNDIGDVNNYLPGLLTATHEWFRVYKIPNGKPENRFAFNGEFKGKQFALGIVGQTHDNWKQLIRANSEHTGGGGLNTETHYPDAANPANDNKWADVVSRAPPHGLPYAIPGDADKSYFIK